MIQHFIRDDYSGAAVNNNIAELHKYRNKRRKNADTEQRLLDIELNIETLFISINNVNAIVTEMLKQDK